MCLPGNHDILFSTFEIQSKNEPCCEKQTVRTYIIQYNLKYSRLGKQKHCHGDSKIARGPTTSLLSPSNTVPRHVYIGYIENYLDPGRLNCHM